MIKDNCLLLHLLPSPPPNTSDAFCVFFPWFYTRMHVDFLIVFTDYVVVLIS